VWHTAKCPQFAAFIATGNALFPLPDNTRAIVVVMLRSYL
jgi:hypothetical protein